MTNAPRSGAIHEENSPLCAARTRRKHFVSVDDVTAVNSFQTSPKTNEFSRLTRLRLSTPGYPFFSQLDHALKPTALLLFICHSIKQHQRINVTLPATSQRKIDLGDLSGHHPESEDVVAVWSKPETAVLLRNCGS